ncbi:MAG: ferredoxin III, nif-specific [Gallionellales bacterium GWA2_60_18]|nr:MAG: ferredoxin III, nif-specific [Gallionellales bacterium GWA2_60_18]
MTFATVTLPNGYLFTPKFVQEVNEDKCIGCGRCFKVCSHGVLQLMGINDEGERVAFDEDEDDEYEKKVMSVAQPGNCIGCEACAHTCTKKAFSHAPMMAG